MVAAIPEDAYNDQFQMATKPYLGATAELHVGKPLVVESNSEDSTHGVVFEDEGETSYFYARDYSQDHPFVDALNIYSVKGVTDANIPSVIRIIWSTDWTKAALLINDYPHAMFDFSEKIGYNRDVFPEADPRTGWTHEKWSNHIREHFYPKREQ